MKKQTALSPEKYIATKSRSLEIHHCYIIGDTEDGKLQVIISRKHKTGNITVGFYLVDLWCMGIKDSFFKFNVPEMEFSMYMEEMLDDVPATMAQIDYVTAHNIIYAAYEYALDLEIKQSPVFEKTTKYLLEKDNDDIPLIEIECGRDGRPFYEQGDESPAEAKKILKTLEKNVGKDGFDYILLKDSISEDEKFINELQSMTELQKKYKQYTLEELRDEYLALPPEERIDTDPVPFSIIYNLREALDKFYQDKDYPAGWKKMLDYTVDNNYITHSLLGDNSVAVSEEDEELFSGCIKILLDYWNNKFSAKKFGDVLKKLKENYPDLAFARYIETKVTGNGDWKSLIEKFPGYPLAKLESHLENGDTVEHMDLKSVFGSNRNISSYEAFVLLNIALREADNNQKFEDYISLQKIIMDADLFEDEAGMLLWTINEKRIPVIEKYMTEKILPSGK